MNKNEIKFILSVLFVLATISFIVIVIDCLDFDTQASEISRPSTHVITTPANGAGTTVSGGDEVVNIEPDESEEESIDILVESEEASEISEPEIVEESIDENSIIEPNMVTYYFVPMDADLQDHIIILCRQYSLDPAIVFAMIDLESNFDPLEVGDGGDSKGLMQVQAKWHQKRMDKLGVTDLFDPYQNVKVGIDYLGELNQKGKSIEWVLMAYNGGPRYANRKTKEGVVTKYAERVINDSKLIRTYEDYSSVR